MHPLVRSLTCGVALLVVAGLASVLSAQQTSRDATKPTIGTASIVGTVIADEPNGKPVRRVTVTISMASTGMSVQRMTVTDDLGRFAFTRLPAGNYGAPRAARPGYVPVTYGQKRPGEIGTPLTLSEGQRQSIAFKMLRGAVITGAVFDQSGKPAPQTSVEATPVRLVNGVRTQAPYIGNISATTDDRGIYRIYGLAPGDYVVVAVPRFASSGELRPITDAEIRWAQQQLQPQTAATSAATAAVAPPPRPAQAVAFSPVYYPGTTDATTATLVTVTAGQERTGVDFGVQFVPTARIEGTVLDQTGLPPQTVQINLVPKIDPTAIMGDSFFLLDSMMMMRPIVVNGRFSLTGVKPGDYTLLARAAPRAGEPGAAPQVAPAGRGSAPAMTLWASTDISVDGNDQSGLALQLQPGMTVSGRVVFDGTVLQPPADLSRVSLRLSAAPSPGGVTVSVGGSAAEISADGTFKLPGVTPGKYFLTASAPAATPVAGTSWLMRSAMLGRVDVGEAAFEVKPGQDITNVVVTFTDKAAEISGTLLDAAGHPTPEFSVILFGTDKTTWTQRSRRLRYPVRTSTDGKFKFTGLLPGEYYLAALTDFEQNDVTNPVFLEQVAAAAMKVTVAEGEKKVQDMKVAGGS